MRLCNETITVFNAKLDKGSGNDLYYPTVISGVSWFCETVSTVSEGLKAADKFTVRVPENADFAGKAYADPLTYSDAEDVTGLFTLKSGDIIVRGIVTETGLRPAALHKSYEAFTILGVTDNRRAPRAPHWKVIGA